MDEAEAEDSVCFLTLNHRVHVTTRGNIRCDNCRSSITKTQRQQVTDFLNGFLKCCSFHVPLILLLFAFILLLHVGVYAGVVHIISISRTRWILRNFLHRFKHALKGVQHESIGQSTEVHRCYSQDYDHPNGSCHVDNRFCLSLSLNAVDNAEFQAVLGDASYIIFLNASIIINISINFALVWVYLNLIRVPRGTIRISHLKHNSWVKIFLVKILVIHAHLRLASQD